MKKICPSCQEECANLFEVVVGGVQRIYVCFRCKRAHLAYERQVAKKREAGVR